MIVVGAARIDIVSVTENWLLLIKTVLTQIVSGAQGHDDGVSAFDGFVHVFRDQHVAREDFHLFSEFLGHATGIPHDGTHF